MSIFPAHLTFPNPSAQTSREKSLSTQSALGELHGGASAASGVTCAPNRTFPNFSWASIRCTPASNPALLELLEQPIETAVIVLQQLEPTTPNRIEKPMTEECKEVGTLIDTNQKQ